MPTKFIIFVAMTVGSLIGGYLPVLFGADIISYSSVLFSGVGGILGVIIGYKISQL
jgi:hypothetical protein